MKKGFTLVELLIVMVIVGVLATIALPKYQASLERGRALEGIANLKAASDYINTHYEMEGSYGGVLNGDFTKSKNFDAPVLEEGDSNCNGYSDTSSDSQVYIIRRGGWNYTLYACNQNGKLRRIYCSGSESDCSNIGMTCSGGKCYMEFNN